MKRWMVFFTLIAFALSTIGAAASGSAPPLVGTLTLSSPSGTPGATVLLDGRIPGHPHAKVWLQRRDGGRFVDVDRATTNGQSRYAFTTSLPDDRSSATYRVRSADGVTKARTVVTGVTTRLTMDPDPTKYPEDGIGAGNSAISGDGHWIAYVSQGAIFLLDRVSGKLQQITDFDVGAAAPSLSTNGRYIAYVMGVYGGAADIAVFDRLSGTTSLLTSDGLGNFSPTMSGDGGRVAYVRYGGDHRSDVYMWDRGLARVRRVTHGNASSSAPDISADGRWLVFTSGASNLVMDDRYPNSDVFIWNTRSHPRDVRRLTHGISRSTYATVSSDGRFVALVSTGPPVKGNVSNSHFGVYLRDRTSGITRRITVASAGAMTAEISDNGNHVVYRLRRSSPSPVPGWLQIWDRNTGTTTMLPTSPPAQDPRVSADGRHVVYQGTDPDPIYPTDVYLWDRLD